MRKFTGQEVGKLLEMVMEVTTPDDFRLLLKTKLDKNFYALTSSSSKFRIQVFDIIENANSKLWHLDLLTALTDENSNNDELLKFASEFIQTNANTSNLEKIVNDYSNFYPPDVLRTKLFELENQVCQIEFDSFPAGTGFLVGHDKVLTNYHVMEAVFENIINASSVKCRFDYKVTTDSNKIYDGTFVSLSSDPVLAYSKYSQKDLVHTPTSESWGEEELDYCLIQLERSIGKEIPGINRTGTPLTQSSGNEDIRGWVHFKDTDLSYDPNSPIFIMQHPKRQALKLSMGRLDKNPMNANKTRFRYDANTLRGSSGSPCFNHNWNWIGIHHAGDPDWEPEYNQGIPIELIIKSLQTHGIEL